MRHAAILVGSMFAAAVASADIYKCTDGSGHATYSNVQARGCTRIIASPAPAPAQPAARPVVPGAKPGTPADFPRIDAQTQRARDDGRRRILDAELANEQKALDDAKRHLSDVQASGVNPTQARDRVALHERNIEALRKEIGNLR
jgi:hypothetical protein